MSYERENVDSYDVEARPTREKDVAVEEELNDISGAGDYRPIPAVSGSGDQQPLTQPRKDTYTSQPSHEDVVRLETERERLKKVNEEKNMVFDIIFNQLPDTMKQKLDRGLHEAKNDHEEAKFSELSTDELKRLTQWLVEYKPFGELEESQEDLPKSIEEDSCLEGLSEPVFPQPRPEQRPLSPAPQRHSRGKKAVQRTNSVLGEGTHGCVTIVKHNGIHYAAKELTFGDPNYITHLYREAANLALLEHKNIVPFCGIGVYEGECYGCHLILTELLATSLHKYLQNAQDIHPGNKVSVLFDVLSGLQYMHQRPVVIHGDIKSNNILLSKNGVAKVADLGSAKLALDNSDHTTNVAFGATAYTAPEISRKEYTEKVDVFAYGHLALVTLTRWEMGVHEMAEINGQCANKQIRRRKRLINYLKNPLLKKMLPALEKCLLDEPNQRPTMEHLEIELQSLDLPRAAPFVTIDTPVCQINSAGTQTE